MSQYCQVLSCPNQTKRSVANGVKRPRMVVPMHPKISSCDKVFCIAYLYAKQCHQMLDSQAHID